MERWPGEEKGIDHGLCRLVYVGAMYWLLRLFDFKWTTRTNNFMKIVLIEAATASNEIYFYAVQISRTANLRISSTSLEPLSGEGHPFTLFYLFI